MRIHAVQIAGPQLLAVKVLKFPIYANIYTDSAWLQKKIQGVTKYIAASLPRFYVPGVI
jgi:hypothetical protein